VCGKERRGKTPFEKAFILTPHLPAKSFSLVKESPGKKSSDWSAKVKISLAAFLLIFVSPRTRGESFLFENHSLQSGKTFKRHPEIATTLPITT